MRKFVLAAAVSGAALALSACGQENIDEVAADATDSDTPDYSEMYGDLGVQYQPEANDPSTFPAIEAKAQQAYRATLPEEQRDQAIRDRIAELKARQ